MLSSPVLTIELKCRAWKVGSERVTLDSTAKVKIEKTLFTGGNHFVSAVVYSSMCLICNSSMKAFIHPRVYLSSIELFIASCIYRMYTVLDYINLLVLMNVSINLYAYAYLDTKYPFFHLRYLSIRPSIHLIYLIYLNVYVVVAVSSYWSHKQTPELIGLNHETPTT